MLTKEEKLTVLSEFPNIKLSYETILHKKVDNYDIAFAIPFGKKCFAWFTTFNEQETCFILELDFSNKKEIKHIKIVNCCFTLPLCYGTVVYGTLFYHMNNPFFTIEDIFWYKGHDISCHKFPDKFNKIVNLVKNDIRQISYNNHYLVFGLPVIATPSSNLDNLLSEIKYKINSVQYIKNNMRYSLHIDEYNNIIVPHEKNTNIEKTIEKPRKEIVTNTKLERNYQTKIFICKPDIQNDIYKLYSLDNQYIGFAGIPDYKTSVMMNKLFRTIKENEDLDALEESDDEEEFEDPNICKFVYLDKSHKLECIFNYKYKKWIPIKIA